MILYIHGFGGSGLGTKAQQTRQFAARDGIPCVAPSLSHIPELAIDTLVQTCESLRDHPLLIIGSSLGGFYARYLGKRFNTPTVLLNPALHAKELLADYTGMLYSYYDDTPWLWQESHVQQLKQFEVPAGKLQSESLVYVETGDEVIPYEETIGYLGPESTSKVITITGGNHSFVSYEDIWSDIVTFYTKMS